MKKVSIFFALLIIILSLSSCSFSALEYLLTNVLVEPEDKILKSLEEYDDYEFYSEGEFQDFTYYAKYFYSSANLAENEYFTKIQKADITNMNDHLDDFEGWIETFKEGDPQREIVVNYDFDRSIIDTEDYIYIESELLEWDNGHTSYANYNIYFFDTQTQILYYFHNNI